MYRTFVRSKPLGARVSKKNHATSRPIRGPCLCFLRSGNALLRQVSSFFLTLCSICGTRSRLMLYRCPTSLRLRGSPVMRRSLKIDSSLSCNFCARVTPAFFSGNCRYSALATYCSGLSRSSGKQSTSLRFSFRPMSSSMESSSLESFSISTTSCSLTPSRSDKSVGPGICPSAASLCFSLSRLKNSFLSAAVVPTFTIRQFRTAYRTI